MRLLSLAVFVSLLAEPSVPVESVQFYDWEAEVVSKEERTTCVIHFTGITQNRIVIVMNLSLVEEKAVEVEDEGRYFTLIKVSAGHIHKIDLSDVTPIKIQSAWIKTIAGSSEGKIDKINDGPNPYFLGGTKGFDLFQSLVLGIKKEGVVVHFVEGPDLEKVFRIPPPPPEIIEEVSHCATVKI
ncbi:MAG: hypothetical protein ABGX83_02840 [Nitrospira sp.]